MPTRDGSWGEDEDDEVEEVRSPWKRKWVGTDEGSRDRKGKWKMTEAEWEVESRWRDWMETRLESMDSVLRKIVGCLEGIGEMIEDRWFVKETEEMEEKQDADADVDEEGEVEDAMVE